MLASILSGKKSTFGTKRRTTNISEFRISKERKMNYSIYLFSNLFLFLYLLKLFEHLKYMIIYEI